MENDNSERKPLLSTSSAANSSRNEVPESISVPPIRSEDLPQTIASNNLLACLVCGSMIDISDKKEQHVVKCVNCNEATPIRAAPPGRRFVRCPCNCLLVCNVNANRISCPRAQCRRIIIVTPDSPTTNELSRNIEVDLENGSYRGLSRISCAHCGGSFFFSALDNCPARCPHCRKLSSVSREFSRKRGFIFLTISLVFLAITLGVLFGTLGKVEHGYGGFIALDVIFGLFFLFFCYRAIAYLSMKVSKVIQRPTTTTGDHN